MNNDKDEERRAVQYIWVGLSVAVGWWAGFIYMLLTKDWDFSILLMFGWVLSVWSGFVCLAGYFIGKKLAKGQRFDKRNAICCWISFSPVIAMVLTGMVISLF